VLDRGARISVVRRLIRGPDLPDFYRQAERAVE